MAAAATAFAAGAAEGADLDSGSAGGGHTDQPADGPTIAEGLAALPPSPGEIPRAVQDAFDKVEQAAKEDPLAAINEFGNLMSVTAQELFGRQLGGGGQGEALENKVAKAEGSEGFGTSFRGEAAEAGAAVAGELGEAGLEVLAAGGQAMGEFLGSVVSAAGDMIEKGAAGLEALGKGDVGEAAALFGEGVVDTLDEAADAGLAVIKGGIGMAGEVIEGAGEVAREIGEGAAEMAQGAVNDVSDAISEFVDRPW